MAFSKQITLGTIGDFTQTSNTVQQQIEPGDFNGDGKTDFLVTRVKGEGNTPSTFRFMIGDGKGQWVDQTEQFFSGTLPTSYFAPRVLVADLNKDGRSDVFVPDFGPHSTFAGAVDQVWLSTASGTYSVAEVSSTKDGSHGISSGDIDRDGDIDVIVDTIDFKIPHADRIWVNNGSGTFADTQSLLPVGARTGASGRLSHSWSGLIDVTGDGYVDLILGTWDTATGGPIFSPPSQLLFNDGKGSFANSPTVQLPQSPIKYESVTDIDGADLNGDGLNDLIMTITEGNPTSPTYHGTGYLQLLINRGGGQFTDETSIRYPAQVAGAPGAWWKFTRLVDMNQDGALDILVTGAGPIAFSTGVAAKVLLNDGTGKFAEAFTVPTPPMSLDGTVAADVDGDGVPDLVSVQWMSPTSALLSAYVNDLPKGLALPAGTINRYDGTASADTLAGSSAIDALVGNSGNDAIDGGASRDTAIFTGVASNYTITKTSTGYTVKDNVGNEGTDSLVNVERLKFSDKTIAIDISGNAGQAYRLYQAAFDRIPDKGGLTFQTNALDGGWGLASIAQNFIDSPEFASTYGALNNTQFVTQLYANVLNRAPDSEGLAYHVGNLNGGMSRAAVLVGFSESPENQAAVIGVIQNGIELG